LIDPWTGAWLVVAGLVAGAVNAVAGGGSLVSFPALMAAGIPPLAANGTNTVALVPGAVASAWEYRAHLGDDPRLSRWLVAPSAVGGALGTALVLWVGDEGFAASVPWLILGATALFAVSEPLGAWAARHVAGTGSPWALAALQLPVAVYGGFFGAGIGILMLAAFALAGVPDLHRRNALKSGAAVWINGVAALGFVLSRQVDPLSAGIMALGAVIGGRYGARLALWLGRERVRAIVVLVGLSSAAWVALR
jgi:hypothetical protein